MRFRGRGEFQVRFQSFPGRHGSFSSSHANQTEDSKELENGEKENTWKLEMSGKIRNFNNIDDRT